MRTLLVISATLAFATLATTQDAARPSNAAERFDMRVVATGLAAPWEIAWGPDGQLWVTERQGRRIVAINPADGSKRSTDVAGVHQSVSQDGLLGLVFHPEFGRGTGNDAIYVAYTYDDDPGSDLLRRLGIRRYRYDSNGALTDPVDILKGLPAHDDHVGGRLAVGADRRLYLTIGDQGSNFGGNRCNVNRAQELPTAADVRASNWLKYQGKILRIELDGSIPRDNPEIDGVRSHVFSYGHRNPLGLAVGPDGTLYESEHGPSSDDEVNLIEAGRNYGWPQVAGYRDDKAYTYANWSASSPQPCASLPGRGGIPASVPIQTETAWNHPRFTPPLQTFFTVETGTDISAIGTATIAPGGLAVYADERGIPGWNRSLLALSLIRGTVYRLPLDAGGRTVRGMPIATLQSANRYRDIALGPDGRTIYLITDVSGPYRDSSGRTNVPLANPGSILEFKYVAP